MILYIKITNNAIKIETKTKYNIYIQIIIHIYPNYNVYKYT